MSNGLKIFKFGFQEVKTVMKDGEPWFAAKDIAEILGYSNTANMNKRLDEDEKTNIPVWNNGYQTNITIVNESGLYNAIIGSKKTEAKQFKKWVTSEVLPDIRKHGMYATDQVLEKSLTDPDYMIGLLQNYKAEKERRLQEEAARKAAELVIENQKPMVESYNELINSDGGMTITQAAKVLGMGQKQLFQILRDNNVIYKSGGDNVPYQRFVDSGYMFVKVGGFGGYTKKQPYVTATGLEYIRRSLKKLGYTVAN